MNLNKIVPIEKNMPHRVGETICVKCYHRAITAYPESVLLKNLECKNCGTGFIILTGEANDT